MITDKERLDWFESTQGFAMVGDGTGRWAVVYGGFQNVLVGDGPSDGVFWIEKKEWKNSVREAIDAAMEEIK